MGILTNLLAGILFAPSIIYFTIVYVLRSQALYAIAKRRNIKGAWLVWVPVANNWIMGTIADDYNKTVVGKKTGWKIALLVVGIVSALFAFLYVIPFVGYFLYLPFMVGYGILKYMAFHKIYRSCNPGKSLVYIMFSIFAPVEGFFLYSVKDEDLGINA